MARAHRLLPLLACAALARAHAAQALSTEAFLDTLGVNAHLDGNSGWDTDPQRVGAHLRHLGVRLLRDWTTSPESAERFAAVQAAWSPLGRLWLSLPEGAPAEQRRGLALTEALVEAHGRGLVYAVGGPNEEDDDYAQRLGATLPDAALVQAELFRWAHADGRDVPVSQMEFGAGWTAANGWRGDYDPRATGIAQPYTPGPADFAASHAYVAEAPRTPRLALDQLRALARLTTPGRPVAHTETGIYRTVAYPPELVGRYLVAGAFDAALAGDTAYIVYGLQDSDTFGFFDEHDVEPNPAATYYHALTTLLASARGAVAPGEATTFAPASLATVWTDAPDRAHLLLQKPTGEFVIAAWSEQPPDGAHPVTDRIGFGRVFHRVAIHDVESGVAPIRELADVDACDLELRPSEMYLVVLSDGG